ncbi:hypothetical protein C8R43DRAFT_1140990 [Mycena crocata]|nr:hypothetical protein C8R43DRAFT_1140990 [Mycena crocata]
MSDDDYNPNGSSPHYHIMSQHHYWEEFDRKALERKQLRPAPYRNSMSPSPQRVKLESVSPAQTPRLSAVNASKHFAADDQYGLYLNSQVGDNTCFEQLCNPTNNSMSGTSDHEDDAGQDLGIKPEPELEVTMNSGRVDSHPSPDCEHESAKNTTDPRTKPVPCVNCTRLIGERDMLYDEWYDEWHAARAACEKMELERDRAILERDAAVAERNRLDGAAVKYFEVVGIHLQQN